MKAPAPDKATQPYLPHYEVLESLGEGAVATVHKVCSIGDGAIFALKSLKPRYAGTDRAVKRFEDEFRVLHRLHHPSLPEVFDYGITEGGTRYIVMELVEGVPLGAYFSNNKSDFWLLLYQLTEALSFIHEHKLLHLDLKPGNVLIKRTRAYSEEEMPLAVLIDFGVSYRRDEGGGAKMIGTPAYMPPEIIRGEENPTRAADYYSLGAMLYEMVEGKVPFAGSMDDVLRAHLKADVEFEGTRVEYASVYPWIEKLMSKEPGPRLEAFGEFRRMVGERVAGSVEGLEKAYALGFIESLGLFGKRQVWDTVASWTSNVTSRRGTVVGVGRTQRSDSPVVEPGTSGPDFAARVREDLLSASGSEEAPDVPDPRRVQRYMNVTGPRGSGKAFMLAGMRAHLLPAGHRVVWLDDRRDYASLLASDDKEKAPTDPRAFAIERFKAGWDRILAEAEQGGVVIGVRHHESLTSEARQFLEYVIKHLELLVAEGSEAGVFVVVGSENPHTKLELCTLIANESNCLAVETPPPATEDVDAIVAEFHGHMSGADERRKLAEYLKTDLTTDGAVMTSLRHAVTEGGLIYRGGHWEFHGVKPLSGSDGGSNEYYRQLLPELPALGRTLAQWLSCHPGRLAVRQIAAIANVKPAEIRRAIAELRSYRLLDVTAAGSDLQVGFTSDGVRESVYSTLDKKSRRQKHSRFVGHLGASADTLEGLESIMFHFEQLGRRRDALLARVKAVRIAKHDGDIYSVRRLCTAGAVYARQEEAGWPAERYFIKSLIDAEWTVSNYSGIIKVVEDHLTRHQREIPASFLYKYAYALDSSGRFNELDDLIAELDSRPPLEARIRDQILVLKVSALHVRRHFGSALGVLRELEVGRLPWWVQAKFHTMSVLVQRRLGNESEAAQSMRELLELATDHKNYEHVLRINYHDTLALLNKAQLKKAKKLLADSIRLAAKSGNLRSLCTLYYAASGVYYEEADYSQALQYLDKAIRLGTDIGMDDHVSGYKVRQAATYRELGRFGTTIRYCESLKATLPKEHYFYAMLILLDAHTLLFSDQATACAEETRRAADGVQPGSPLGRFHQLLGNLLFTKCQYEDALTEYTRALALYESGGVEDDWVKTKISVAEVNRTLGNTELTADLLRGLEDRVQRLESPSVIAEHLIAWVGYYLKTREDSRRLVDAIEALDKRRAHPASVATKMGILSTLFESYVSIGSDTKAAECFGEYYAMLKLVCSDLVNPQLLSTYTTNPEFTRLLSMFQQAQKKRSPD